MSRQDESFELAFCSLEEVRKDLATAFHDLRSGKITTKEANKISKAADKGFSRANAELKAARRAHHVGASIPELE